MKSITTITAVILICLFLVGCGEKKKITYTRIPQSDGSYKLGVCDPEGGCYIVDDAEAFGPNTGGFPPPPPRLSAK